MDKLIDCGLPCVHAVCILLYWAGRIALVLVAATVQVAFIIVYLALVWFIKGSPPRLVMRYL